jgi:hypothetical protein
MLTKLAIAIAAFIAGAMLTLLAGCATHPRTNLLVYVVRIEESQKWIWQITAANNQLIAESEQEFESCEAAIANYTIVRDALRVHASPAIVTNPL